MPGIQEALERVKGVFVGEQRVKEVVQERKEIPPPPHFPIPEEEPLEEQEFRLDRTLPKTIIQAFRQGEDLTPICQEKGEWEVVSSLAAITLCDRNYSQGVRYLEGGTVETLHINRKWERTRKLALEALGKIGGEKSAFWLGRIVQTINIAAGILPRDSETLREHARDERVIIPHLTFPAYETFFGTVNFSWFPWNDSWRGGKISPPSDEILPPWHTVHFEGQREGVWWIDIKTLDEPRQKIKARACQILGELDHPKATEELIMLASREMILGTWGRTEIRDIAKESLIARGVELERILPFMEGRDRKDQMKISRAVAILGAEKVEELFQQVV